MLKMIACLIGGQMSGPWFDTWVKNQTFSMDRYQENLSRVSFRYGVRLVVPCTRIYARQVNDPTHELNMQQLQHVMDSCS